ncbi:MAG: shikimate kinase [Saprospiraceae bacterium]|nr:shikimate kinase [Saprospiraceae bacterium]
MAKPKYEYRKLILWGMMGAGKTTAARFLSSKLGIAMIDLDEYLSERSGHTIQGLFSHLGEAGFRDREHLAFRDVLAQPRPLILAPGGGTPCFERNNQLIRHHDMTIYLRCRIETLVNRLKNELNSRPLLASHSEDLHQKISQLLSERTCWYEQARFIVDADDPDADDRLLSLATAFFTT